jgi:hypothetical protein
MSMNHFVNTASVETSRFLVLFIMKLNGLIIKKTYSLSMCQLKKSFDNTNS